MGLKKLVKQSIKSRRSSRSKSLTREERLIRRIQGALSLDLLHPKYGPSEAAYENATTGHCYIAAEAAYHLFGREAGFVPYVHNYGDGNTGGLSTKRQERFLTPRALSIAVKSIPTI